ncbi:MAG: 6-pyruvoyl tetrahydropterin synthase family protein [Candidatus Binatia bacterium]
MFVSKDDFRFNAAHFMAYPGFRERLHGHNYRVGVRVEGELGEEGYVVDFGDVKRAARAICSELNERLIVPAKSDCLRLSREGGQLEIECTDDGSRFSLPEADCVMLPIVHSSAEELAAWFSERLIEMLHASGKRRLTAVEVTVAESPKQEARYHRDLRS